MDPRQMGFLGAYVRALEAAGAPTEPSSYSRDNVGFMLILLAVDLVHRSAVEDDFADRLAERAAELSASVPAPPEERHDEVELLSLVDMFVRTFNLVRDTPLPDEETPAT